MVGGLSGTGANSSSYVRSVVDYGAIGDGVTDDTAAFNRALAANQVVAVPPKTFAVNNVTMNNGNRLIGLGGMDMGYPETPANAFADTTLYPMLVPAAGAGNLLNITSIGNIYIGYLSMIGSTTGTLPTSGAAYALAGTGASHLALDHVAITNCHSAWGLSNYPHLVHADSCLFGNCYLDGVDNCVDSLFVGCDFAGNGGNGISFGSGAGSSSLIGCRFEWNTLAGVNLGDGNTGIANQIVISGGWFDRNGFAGITTGPAQDIAVTGCNFMRNGKADAALWSQAHIYLNNVARFTIAGCTTNIGADDGGGGTVSPRYAVSFDVPPGAGVVMTGNNFSGYTTAFSTGTIPADLVTSATAHVTSGSAVITNLSSTTGVSKGQRLSGTGIPVNQTVASVDSASQVTCNLLNTATNTTVAVTFKGDYVQANNIT